MRVSLEYQRQLLLHGDSQVRRRPLAENVYGKSITLEAEASDTVENVKVRTEDNESISIDCVRCLNFECDSRVFPQISAWWSAMQQEELQYITIFI